MLSIEGPTTRKATMTGPSDARPIPEFFAYAKILYRSLLRTACFLLNYCQKLSRGKISPADHFPITYRQHQYLRAMLDYKPFDLAIGGLLLEGTGAALFTITTFMRDANSRDQCDVPATIYCCSLFILGIAVIVLAHRRAQASLWRLLFNTNFWGAGGAPGVYLYFNGRNDWGSVVFIMWGIIVGMVVSVCKEEKLRDKPVLEEDSSKPECAMTDSV